MNTKLKNEELKRLSVEEYKKAKKIPLVVVLDNVRSLHNVGSVFRTADAFSVEAVFLCGISATPAHRDIRKTALGATESVEWKQFETTMEAVRELREKGYRVLSVEQAKHTVRVNDFYPEEGRKHAVVFGNEVKGVEQEVINASDACIEVPQFGTKHSLNIAVSAGIVLWELYGKMWEPGK